VNRIYKFNKNVHDMNARMPKKKKKKERKKKVLHIPTFRQIFHMQLWLSQLVTWVLYIGPSQRRCSETAANHAEGAQKQLPIMQWQVAGIEWQQTCKQITVPPMGERISGTQSNCQKNYKAQRWWQDAFPLTNIFT
jgi:cytoskeletal protein RodZ